MAIQAAVMTEPGAVEVREFPDPDIAADELLLDIESTGICGSDKHIYAGHMPLQFPLVPGHELVGRIAELGSNAAEEMAVVGGPLAEGDRVTTTPSSTACGRCHYCLHMPQRPTLCTGRYVHGFVSCDLPPAPRGGFAEQMHLGPRSWIFKIPDDLSSDRAVLTEPAAVATRAVERALGPGIPHIGEGLGMDKSVLVLGGRADRTARRRRPRPHRHRPDHRLGPERLPPGDGRGDGGTPGSRRRRRPRGASAGRAGADRGYRPRHRHRDRGSSRRLQGVPRLGEAGGASSSRSATSPTRAASTSAPTPSASRTSTSAACGPTRRCSSRRR